MRAEIEQQIDKLQACIEEEMRENLHFLVKACEDQQFAKIFQPSLDDDQIKFWVEGMKTMQKNRNRAILHNFELLRDLVNGNGDFFLQLNQLDTFARRIDPIEMECGEHMVAERKHIDELELAERDADAVAELQKKLEKSKKSKKALTM